MTTRRELISSALKERFSELLDRRVSSLETAAPGPANFFIEVREKFSGMSPADARSLIVHPRGLDYWTAADIGCRQALLALSLGQSFNLHEDEQPPIKPFTELLNAARREPERYVQLLSERYSSPLSFILPAEEEVRELILTRLMTQGRARIEKQAGDGDGAKRNATLLLELNLVAVMAARASDLRFLDALNYYYELLPAWSSPTGHDDSLLASYFALYAQALAAWM